MNVTDETGKNYDAAQINTADSEKCFSKIYSRLLFCVKPLSKSSFVQFSNH